MESDRQRARLVAFDANYLTLDTQSRRLDIIHNLWIYPIDIVISQHFALSHSVNAKADSIRAPPCLQSNQENSQEQTGS